MVELGPVMLPEELTEVMVGADPEPAPFVPPDPILLATLFDPHPRRGHHDL
jgi:hypothetical protein